MATSTAVQVDDQKFLKEAAIRGLTEVDLGKLAAQKGGTDAVKQFGQRMVQDHAKTNDHLTTVATKAGYSIPDSLDSKHQARVNKLSKLSGPEFDKAFLKNEVNEQETDLRNFQDESQNGTNALVKAFAAETLPTLQAHLKMAKDLRKSAGTSVSEASN